MSPLGHHIESCVAIIAHIPQVLLGGSALRFRWARDEEHKGCTRQRTTTRCRRWCPKPQKKAQTPHLCAACSREDDKARQIAVELAASKFASGGLTLPASRGAPLTVLPFAQGISRQKVPGSTFNQGLINSGQGHTDRIRDHGEHVTTKIDNGALLLGRVALAACVAPSAIAHTTNVSGFAALLSKQGLPYAHVLATVGLLIELFGPLALVLGLAPRLTSSLLFVFEVFTAAALHCFWLLSGAARQLEQVLFLTNLGLAAGLLFYFVTGSGGWSLGSLWRGGSRQANPKAAQAKPKIQKPRGRGQALSPRSAAA